MSIIELHNFVHRMLTAVLGRLDISQKFNINLIVSVDADVSKLVKKLLNLRVN